MKLSSFHLISLFALFTYTLCAQRFSIISPSQLYSQFDEDGIPYSLGNYGKTPYGAHFIGGLALANPIDACTRITNFLIGEMQLDQQIIAIVQAGGCPNMVKIRNAQLAGAKLVVIVQDSDVTPSTGGFGTGADTSNIHIPTIFISKTHGGKLIKFLEGIRFPPLNPEDTIPIANINFPYDPVGQAAKLDFWMTSNDMTTYKFLNGLSSYIIMSEQTFDFTPHFVTWDCYMCRANNYNIPVTGDCISGGRYCAPDPDGDDGPLEGKDILYEDIRQVCLWQANLWWEYIPLYVAQCSSTSNIEVCSSDILTSIASSSQREAVKKCFDDSFFQPENSQSTDRELYDNSILAAQKELQLEYDIVAFPALLINHRPYAEDLKNVEDVVEDICKYVSPSKGYCKTIGGKTEIAIGNTDNSNTVGTVLLLVVVLLVSAVVIFYFFRRSQKRKFAMEISMQANNMVSSYMAIGDFGKTAQTSA